MSRLTCKYDGINTLREMCTFDRESDIEADDCLNCEEYCDTMDALGGDCDNCAIQKAFDKLAEYEDLEEKGLLLKLPCKVGDTVWVVDKELDCYEGYQFMTICGEYVMVASEYVHCAGNFQKQLDEMAEESYDCFGVSIEIFHRDTVFLTKEEAEKELNMYSGIKE